jgi:uncharacterized protein YwqG
MRNADVDAWEQLLVERGLDSELAKTWAHHARPHIRLHPVTMHSVDNTEIGRSKLGGLPDLQDGLGWPTRPAYQFPRASRPYIDPIAWEERPLAFLAQFDLREIAKAGCDLPLPESGLLSFFYDAETQPWGFDPLEAPGWRVIFMAEETALRRERHPQETAFPVQALELVPFEGLPSQEWIQDRLAQRPDFALDAFYTELQKLDDADLSSICYSGIQLGGWPNPVQSTMELECEMAMNGISTGGPEGYRDPRVASLRQRAGDWRLLLQVDSDEQFGWMWGDMGTLYFMCREDDIAQRRFDRVWTILQCT